MSGEDALVYWGVWAVAAGAVAWFIYKLDIWFPIEKDDRE